MILITAFVIHIESSRDSAIALEAHDSQLVTDVAVSLMNAEVIDLCALPTPSPPRVRSRSKSRLGSLAPKETFGTSEVVDLTTTGFGVKERKGKGKQPSRPLGQVIELSESDSEYGDYEKSAPHLYRNKEQEQQPPLAGTSQMASGSGLTPNLPLHNAQPTRDVDDSPAHLVVQDRRLKNTDDDFEERIPGPSNRSGTPAIPVPNTNTPTNTGVIPNLDPVPAVDPSSQTLARILEVIPNIDPEFLYPRIAVNLPNFEDDPIRTAEFMLGSIFEMGDEVPRITKGKRKGRDAGVGSVEDREDRKEKKAKVDWASTDRPFTGTDKYVDLALIHLQTSFPHIPKRYLRRRLMLLNCHYAPTHLALSAEEKAERKDYEPKVTRYNPEKERAKMALWNDPVLDEERSWIIEREEGDENVDQGKGKAKVVDVELEEGEGIECQCCFSEYPFDKMVQCPETHLFCKECVLQYASTQLGSHCATLVCMHPSQCEQPFPESELRRVLDGKLMELYERVKQQKEIEDAGFDDLEECPFCEWKCVIEASKEEEKLFRCGNEEGDCGVVSCRMCKKEDHLPKSCKEVEDDKQLGNQHAIEEAMTQALMRQCPKCKKPFIKEAGCNKMTCPHCHTMSCYICRQIIIGYDHFNQAPANAPSSSRNGDKCILWDPVEQRHADEVKAAAEKALADFKKRNPDADADSMKIDIPKAPPAPVPNIQYNAGFNNQFNFAAMNAPQAAFQPMMQQPRPGPWVGGLPVPPAAYMQPPPAAPLVPPAPAPPRGPALVARARRARRRRANADGPRIAQHAANIREPPPIPLRRGIQPGVQMAPVAAQAAPNPAPAPQFRFDLAAPARLGFANQVHPVANNHAVQQLRFRELLGINERNEMARLDNPRLDKVDADERVGVGHAGEPINLGAAAAERHQMDYRLFMARQKVLRERAALTVQQNQRGMAALGAFQVNLQPGVGINDMAGLMGGAFPGFNRGREHPAMR